MASKFEILTSDTGAHAGTTIERIDVSDECEIFNFRLVSEVASQKFDLGRTIGKEDRRTTNALAKGVKAPANRALTITGHESGRTFGKRSGHAHSHEGERKKRRLDSDHYDVRMSDWKERQLKIVRTRDWERKDKECLRNDDDFER